MKTFFFVIDNQLLKIDSSSVWNNLESELKKQLIKYDTLIINDYQQIEYNLKKKVVSDNLKDCVVVSVGNSSFFLNVLAKLRKISLSEIPVAFILINEKTTFSTKIGVSTNPLIALKQILNTVSPTLYNLGSVHNMLTSDEQIFTDELVIGFNAYVTSIVKNSKLYSLFVQYHLPLLADFCAMTEAFINQEAFSVTTRLSEKYNFFKNAFSIRVKNLPLLPEGNSSKINNLQLEVITNLNPFSYWVIFLARKLNIFANFPFISIYSQKQIHLVINSLEFSQIDNKQLINKFYDAQLKSFSYPFWIDTDSVSITEKTNSKK